MAAAPARGVVHTTEGYAPLEAFVGLYNRTGNYPHFTVDPRSKRKGQHIPVSRSATATKNKPGGVETNRLHAIQVEIVWRAGDIRSLTVDQLEWLGREVIAPISTACGISLHSPVFVGAEAGFIARPDAPQRMSYTDWLVFNGWCGHQHVPENDHWDPGGLDMETVLTFARSQLHVTPAATVPPIPTLEDEVPYLMLQDTRDGTIWALFPGGIVRHIGGAEFGAYNKDNKVPLVQCAVNPAEGDPHAEANRLKSLVG